MASCRPWPVFGPRSELSCRCRPCVLRSRLSPSSKCVLALSVRRPYHKAVEVRDATANPKVQILRTSLRLRGITIVAPSLLTLRPVLPARTASNPKALIGFVGVEELECDRPFEFFGRWFHDVASGPLSGCFHVSVSHGNASTTVPQARTIDSSLPRKPWQPFRLTGAFFLWGKSGYVWCEHSYETTHLPVPCVHFGEAKSQDTSGLRVATFSPLKSKRTKCWCTWFFHNYHST